MRKVKTKSGSTRYLIILFERKLSTFGELVPLAGLGYTLRFEIPKDSTTNESQAILKSQLKVDELGILL